MAFAYGAPTLRIACEAQSEATNRPEGLANRTDFSLMFCEVVRHAG
jgi:hypothetical protein